ncbi:hypothetical protein [Bdellovibrio sp.]
MGVGVVVLKFAVGADFKAMSGEKKLAKEQTGVGSGDCALEATE